MKQDLAQHESCECKYRLNGKVCNLNIDANAKNWLIEGLGLCVELCVES